MAVRLPAELLIVMKCRISQARGSFCLFFLLAAIAVSAFGQETLKQIESRAMNKLRQAAAEEHIEIPE